MRKALMMLVAVAALAIGFSACEPADETVPAEDEGTQETEVETETPMDEIPE